LPRDDAQLALGIQLCQFTDHDPDCARVPQRKVEQLVSPLAVGSHDDRFPGEGRFPYLAACRAFISATTGFLLFLAMNPLVKGLSSVRRRRWVLWVHGFRDVGVQRELIERG
jgi:hypothetical protein